MNALSNLDYGWLNVSRKSIQKKICNHISACSFCIVMILINQENVSSYRKYKTMFVNAKLTMWTAWPAQYCFKFMCTCWMCLETVPLTVIDHFEKGGGGEWIFSLFFLFSIFYSCHLDKKNSNIYFIIMVTLLILNTCMVAYMRDLEK